MRAGWRGGAWGAARHSQRVSGGGVSGCETYKVSGFAPAKCEVSGFALAKCEMSSFAPAKCTKCAASGFAPSKCARPRTVASHTVDSAGIVIAFSNLNRSDDSSGRSGDGLQPRGPSRMNGSPGRGTSPPEPCFNTGV